MKTAKEVLAAVLMGNVLAERCFDALREAGYCVVPQEPTEEMIYAGEGEIDALRYDTGAAQAGAAYRAMMEAATLGDEVATLRDALDHIVRVARNARVPTRRLDWIVSRGQRALDGKPFDMDAMPRYPKMQPAVPAVELGRCRTALCTAAELSLLLGHPANQFSDEARAALELLRSQLRELGFAA